MVAPSRLVGGVVIATVSACAAPAVAHAPLPITIEVDAEVTPDRAGTPARPQGVELDVTVRFRMPGDYEPPLLERVEVWFPKGGRYNGHRYPRCSLAVLDRRGPSACPRGSIMGWGTGLAMADSVPTRPRITIVNGGRDRVFFYTTMTNPARVQAPVVARVRRVGGPWSYKATATIPRNLQIVAGIPILYRELRFVAGRRDWLATTHCPPSRRWPYRGRGTFVTGQTLTHSGTVACRPAA